MYYVYNMLYKAYRYMHVLCIVYEYVCIQMYINQWKICKACMWTCVTMAAFYINCERIKYLIHGYGQMVNTLKIK